MTAKQRLHRDVRRTATSPSRCIPRNKKPALSRGFEKIGFERAIGLALRELEATAGAGLAVLLSLDLAGVAGEEALVAHRLFQ
jgi:hypothetical protein